MWFAWFVWFAWYAFKSYPLCNSFRIFWGHFLAFFPIQSFINFVFDKLKVLLKFVSFSFMTYDRYLLTLGVIFGQDSTVLKDSTTYSQIWAKFCRYFYCKQFDYCNTFLVKVMHNYYCNTFLSKYFYCYCNTFIWSITMLYLQRWQYLIVAVRLHIAYENEGEEVLYQNSLKKCFKVETAGRRTTFRTANFGSHFFHALTPQLYMVWFVGFHIGIII